MMAFNPLAAFIFDAVSGVLVGGHWRLEQPGPI